METKSKTNAWFLFAAGVIGILTAAAIRWSLTHPFGIHWDEAQYLDDIQIDGQRLRTGHLLKLIGRIFIKPEGRPPAYRLLALPFIGAFGYHTTEARLVSLCCFVLTAFFIFLAARRIAGPIAGAFAALIFALSPEVLSASIFFGTDAPLFLATASMLYYIFTAWNETERSTSTWIGLGCSVALGFLAKTSFLLIAIPVLVFWLVTSYWTHGKIPSLLSERKAAVLACVIAGPWWLLNIKEAIGYGRYARGFAGNSLGAPSLGTWIRWFETVVRCLLGPALAILIALVISAFVIRTLRKRSRLDTAQWASIGACACAGLPIVAEQLSGTNQLLRHISPSMIPLAIVMGVWASASGWLGSWTATALSFVLLAFQTVLLISPVIRPNHEPLDVGFVNATLPTRTMMRFDQWDWQPAVDLADSCHVQAPEIAFLGGGRFLNPPQIQFSWIRRTTSTRAATLSIPTVTWLWRYEQGPIDWQQVMSTAAQNDMVLTAPGYVNDYKGQENQNNEHNAEFVQRLSTDPNYRGPYHFSMGRFAPVDVQVFMKKSLACPTRVAPQ